MASSLACGYLGAARYFPICASVQNRSSVRRLASAMGLHEVGSDSGPETTSRPIGRSRITERAVVESAVEPFLHCAWQFEP
jgi:hypothetical protein